MKRHYYISDDLDDLEAVEQELEAAGLDKPQFHVLSNNDAGVETHHLHAVESVLKSDVVYKTELGFLVGLVASGLVLTIGIWSGVAETYTLVPVIFLSIVILGFCTWEGGFIGIQQRHHEFARFQKVLAEGKHIFFADVDASQEDILNRVASAHPRMEVAGEGRSTPSLVIGAQRGWHKFFRWGP